LDTFGYFDRNEKTVEKTYIKGPFSGSLDGKTLADAKFEDEVINQF